MLQFKEIPVSAGCDKPKNDWQDSGNIVAIRPMRDGVIADFDVIRVCSAILFVKPLVPRPLAKPR